MEPSNPNDSIHLSIEPIKLATLKNCCDPLSAPNTHSD